MVRKKYTPEFISEVIEMAWDDEATFDGIQKGLGLSEGEVIQIMQRNLKPSSFRMWRERVSGRKTKHEKITKHENLEIDTRRPAE